LEDLAKQFNSMSAQLQRSYAILEQRVAGQTQALSTINAITAVVSRSFDLDEILQDALDKTLEITEMEAGVALRLNEEEQSLNLMAQRGLSPVLTDYLCHLPLTNEAAVQAAGPSLPIIRRVMDYPLGKWRELLTEEGWRLVVSIPLSAKGRFLGTINLFTGTIRAPVMEHLSLLAAIGQQIGVAMENAELYEQAQRLAAAEERQRLARDLHDSVTQALYAVTLYAEAASRLLTTGETALAAEHLHDLRATAQDALRELRLLIFELRPPLLEKNGLVAALQSRLETVEERSGLRTLFSVEGLNGSERLPLEVETGLYRIAQEALNNILKHAQAHEVSVRLNYLAPEARVVLEIRDDGQGFEMFNGAGKGRFGLQTMRERATLLGGTLQITSQPGEGTQVKVEVKG
jgi:signal transduction histidine kinase